MNCTTLLQGLGLQIVFCNILIVKMLNGSNYPHFLHKYIDIRTPALLCSQTLTSEGGSLVKCYTLSCHSTLSWGATNQIAFSWHYVVFVQLQIGSKPALARKKKVARLWLLKAEASSYLLLWMLLAIETYKNSKRTTSSPFWRGMFLWLFPLGKPCVMDAYPLLYMACEAGRNTNLLWLSYHL